MVKWEEHAKGESFMVRTGTLTWVSGLYDELPVEGIYLVEIASCNRKFHGHVYLTEEEKKDFPTKREQDEECIRQCKKWCEDTALNLLKTDIEELIVLALEVTNDVDGLKSWISGGHEITLHEL